MAAALVATAGVSGAGTGAAATTAAGAGFWATVGANAGLISAAASSLESYRQSQISSDLTGLQAIISGQGAVRALKHLPEYQKFAEADLSRRMEGIELGFETEKGLLEANKVMSGLNQGKQRVQEAMAGGNIRLARAEATKVARVESDMVAASNAKMGRSAFGSAFSQMSVNKMATVEQQRQGLLKESEFNRGAYAEQLKVFALQAHKLDTQFDIEMRGYEDARKKLVLDFELKKAELEGIYSMSVAQGDAARKAGDWLGIGDELGDIAGNIKDDVSRVTDLF